MCDVLIRLFQNFNISRIEKKFKSRTCKHMRSIKNEKILKASHCFLYDFFQKSFKSRIFGHFDV
jgi:hypothetical protein